MVALRESLLPVLPDDGTAGALAWRVWRPDVDGPAVVAIRADGVFDAMGDMILENFLLDALQSGAHRRDLGDHIDAIAVLFDHPQQAAHLPLDAVEAFQAGCLGDRLHPCHIPHMGILDKVENMPMKGIAALRRSA